MNIDSDVLPALPSWARKMTKNVQGGKVNVSTISVYQTHAMKTGSYTFGTALGPAAKAAGWNTVNATFGQRVFENQALLSGVPNEIRVLICTESEFLGCSGYSAFVCLCRNGDVRWLLDGRDVGSMFTGQYAALVLA